ncbi:MAG: hypothetical protein RIQ72_17 [Candidatus Parcubacteria bacterium]|jgi:predicted metal-dependent hydrolase
MSQFLWHKIVDQVLDVARASKIGLGSISHRKTKVRTGYRVGTTSFRRKLKVKKTRVKKSQTRQKEYLAQKEKTRLLVQDRVKYFIEKYQKLGIDLKPSGRIAIRDSKTRWGSCSSKGNLNFHWKLGVIPTHLSDYVIVHELCHLKEFNHGAGFWGLVELACPQYRECKAELRLVHLG